MRSLLRGMSLATALVVGASAYLPFPLHAQETTISARDGVFESSVLLELFSEKSSDSELMSLSDTDLESRGYVRDAKKNIYRIRFKEVTNAAGTKTEESTASLVNRGYYLDTKSPSPVIRQRIGTEPHNFDPILYQVDGRTDDHKYYDFGGFSGANGLSADQLAQLRAKVEAMGGRLITDSQGRVIDIVFGNNSRPQNYDQMFAQLVQFFNQSPQLPAQQGGAIIVGTPGSNQQQNTYMGSTGDSNLDNLYAVLNRNRENAGSVVLGSNNGSAGANNGGVIVIGGNANNNGGVGNNSNSNNPNAVILGGNNTNGSNNPNVVVLGGNNSNGGNNNPNPGVVVLGGNAGNNGSGVIGTGTNSNGAGNPNAVIIAGRGQNNLPGQQVVVIGGNGSNGAGANGTLVPPASSGPRVVQITHNGSSDSAMANLSAWIVNSSGMSYPDQAYNLFLMHANLGMHVLKADDDLIRNLSNIQKEKDHVSFWIGEKGQGSKYALAKVRIEEGGLLGIGSKDVWVLTHEVNVNGETSYRLVGADEHKMLVSYVQSKVEEAKASGNKDSIKDWEGILKNLERNDLLTYDADAYSKARSKAQALGGMQLSAGQQLQFRVQSWGSGNNNGSPNTVVYSGSGNSASPGNSAVIIAGNTTAPNGGVNGIQGGNFTPEQIQKLQELRTIYLQQNPQGTDQGFANWLMVIGNGEASTGNSSLDQWIAANFRAPNTGSTQTTSTQNASSSTAPVQLDYVITETNLTDDNGVKLFEITRFKRQGNREFDHKTDFITADQVVKNSAGVWVLKGNAQQTSAPSTQTPGTNSPEQQVDENLKRLEQVITSVNASWVDEDGNVLRTGTARLEPGISASAFRTWAESQGSKVVFDEDNADMRAANP